MQQIKLSIKNIWVTVIASLFLYAFLGYNSLLQGGQPLTFNYNDLANPFFIGAVVLSLILAGLAHYFLPRFIQPDNINRNNLVKLLQILSSWLIGDLGIFLFFLTDSFTQLVFLCILSLISLVKLFPQIAQIDQK
ncbi:MAG: hypothetical protein V3574_00990 [Candidatus Moraniibacteriota bacterium]